MRKNFNLGSSIAMVCLLLTACVNNNSAPVENNGETPPSPVVAPQEMASLEKVEETDPDGNQLQFTRRDSDGLREGVYTKTNSKGVKIEEANYKEGKLDGQRILFYPNGDTLIVETYVKDFFEGMYKSYFPKGKLKMRGEYHNNTMEGTWLQYYETGQLKEEVLFSNNAENGPFKEYHLNGKLSVEGEYKNGDNEQGQLKFYDENGVHTKTMECDMGVCRTIWSQEKAKGAKKRGKK